MKIAFAGAFAARLEERVRAHLTPTHDVILADEAGITAKLADVDVLVTMAFTRDMAAAAKRLKLVQVPGAGLDRIDRAALPAGAVLANAYGHEVGIAEYVMGAMLALTRQLGALDAALRRAARIRLDGGHAGGTGEADRGERGARRPRRAADQSRRLKTAKAGSRLPAFVALGSMQRQRFQ